MFLSQIVAGKDSQTWMTYKKKGNWKKKQEWEICMLQYWNMLFILNADGFCFGIFDKKQYRNYLIQRNSRKCK